MAISDTDFYLNIQKHKHFKEKIFAYEDKTVRDFLSKIIHITVSMNLFIDKNKLS